MKKMQALILFGLIMISVRISVSGAVDPVDIFGHGGPDSLGYYYIDSSDTLADAPSYNWKEISGYGTDLNMVDDDQSVGPISIGFLFKYYRNYYNSLRVCTNGFISFASNSVEYINDPIPSDHDPDNILAVFWDDLTPDSTSHAYFYTNNQDTAIVEWKSFRRPSGGGTYTFEAIITANGNIVYQYNTVSGTLDSHTIGIENQNGTVGLQYNFNVQENETGTAILFTSGMRRVLMVNTNSYDLDFRNWIRGYDDIAGAEVIDVSQFNPTLNQLKRFDAVCVWASVTAPFNDPIALGNILADYVDSGGAVILFNTCFLYQWSLGGRIISDYSPFASGNTTADRSLGTRDVGHPIMSGVNSLSDHYSVNISLAHDPMLVASYNDGTPLVAYDAARKLVAVNANVGFGAQYTGDMIDLCHNIINFALDGSPQILLVASDPSKAFLAIHDLRQFSDISGIHYYNATLSTPSPALLNTYACVDVWSQTPFNDPTLLGDRLADYLDSGGGVVLHQYCFTLGNKALQGRIMNSYSPFAAGALVGQSLTMGQHDQFHPLMAGVYSASDIYAADVTLQNDGVSVATWLDGPPFVAYNPSNRLVAINAYIGDARRTTGDMQFLEHNAINFAMRQTGIGNGAPNLPDKINLAQNYPNPFNATTTIKFGLRNRADVTLDLFNVLGQKIMTLYQGYLDSGDQSLIFDAGGLGSGIYLYRLTAAGHAIAKKMIVLK